jgi:hypothetical protein
MQAMKDLINRLRIPDSMAMRQAADELEALYAMLTDPDWNAAQQKISAWRKARGVGARHVEVTAPLDEAFLDVRFDNRSMCRKLFGLGFGARMLNLYRRDDNGHEVKVTTIRELVRLREVELMREPNIGRRTVDVIRAVLAQHGLYLGMEI